MESFLKLKNFIPSIDDAGMWTELILGTLISIFFIPLALGVFQKIEWRKTRRYVIEKYMLSMLGELSDLARSGKTGYDPLANNIRKQLEIFVPAFDSSLLTKVAEIINELELMQPFLYSSIEDTIVKNIQKSYDSQKDFDERDFHNNKNVIDLLSAYSKLYDLVGSSILSSNYTFKGIINASSPFKFNKKEGALISPKRLKLYQSAFKRFNDENSDLSIPEILPPDEWLGLINTQFSNKVDDVVVSKQIRENIRRDEGRHLGLAIKHVFLINPLLFHNQEGIFKDDAVELCYLRLIKEFSNEVFFEKEFSCFIQNDLMHRIDKISKEIGQNEREERSLLLRISSYLAISNDSQDLNNATKNMIKRIVQAYRTDWDNDVELVSVPDVIKGLIETKLHQRVKGLDDFTRIELYTTDFFLEWWGQETPMNEDLTGEFIDSFLWGLEAVSNISLEKTDVHKIYYYYDSKGDYLDEAAFCGWEDDQEYISKNYADSMNKFGVFFTQVNEKIIENQNEVFSEALKNNAMGILRILGGQFNGSFILRYAMQQPDFELHEDAFFGLGLDGLTATLENFKKWPDEIGITAENKEDLDYHISELKRKADDVQACVSNS